MDVQTWFEEARQSLSIAEPICVSANELVVQGRKNVEHAVLVWGKIHFMQKALDSQIYALNGVDGDLQSIKEQISSEINQTVQRIKLVDQNLAAALKRLESTTVDTAFAKQGGQDQSHTLQSFVHEEGIQDLKDALNQAMDRAKAAVQDISSIVSDVRGNVSSLLAQQADLETLLVKEANKKQLENAHQISVHSASDAHDMAQLLENLTSHYDLCQEALDMMQDEAKRDSDDLREVLQVLREDCKQVESAIEELYSKKAALETGSQEIAKFSRQMDETFAKVKQFWQTVDQFGSTKLTVHTDLVESISATASSAITETQTLGVELESLVEYYSLFYTAYHSMVLEAVRRSNTQQKLQNIVADMEAQLNKLNSEEQIKRQQFIRQYGNYLPADLWPQLEQHPAKPTIHFSPASLPKLKQQTIDKAAKQVSI